MSGNHQVRDAVSLGLVFQLTLVGSGGTALRNSCSVPDTTALLWTYGPLAVYLLSLCSGFPTCLERVTWINSRRYSERWVLQRRKSGRYEDQHLHHRFSSFTFSFNFNRATRSSLITSPSGNFKKRLLEICSPPRARIV